MAREQLDHWRSFRDRMLTHRMMKMLGLNWEKAKASVTVEKPGFADFIESEAAQILIKGAIGQAPALNELYQMACWDVCGRRVIRPSAGLFDLLVRTEAKIPIRDVPAPFRSVYIVLPPGRIRIPGARDGFLEAQGCYVSWGHIGSKGPTAKAFMGIGRRSLADVDYECRTLYVARGPQDRTHHDWTVRFQNLSWTDEEEGTVDELVRKCLDEQVVKQAQLTDPWTRYLHGQQEPWERDGVDEILTRISANLFLYMACPDAEILENPSELHARLADFRKRHVGSKRRKSAKRQIEEGMVPQEVVVGSSIRIQPLDEQTESEGPEGGEGSRRSPRPHWRMGHFRRIPIGEGRRERKLAWIKPVLVRKVAAGEQQPEGRDYAVE